MSKINGLVHLAQRLESEMESREQRKAAARAAFAALTVDDQYDLLVELMHSRLAPQAPTPQTSTPATPTPPPTTPPIIISVGEPTAVPVKTKMDLAEALIKATPGITTREIAAYIQQSPKVAGTTLNTIMKKRETIKNRAGRWYPVAGASEVTFRDAMYQILGDGGRLGLGDIIKAVEAIRPGANKHSVNGEIYRMLRTDPPLVMRDGEGERGALYGLTPEGMEAAAEARSRGAKGASTT